MVEENFEIKPPRMHQNERIFVDSNKEPSPWLKKISKASCPKCTRMKGFLSISIIFIEEINESGKYKEI